MSKKPIPVAVPHTPEWFAARQNGIGASEMSAAVGQSEYRQPLEVYLRKTIGSDDFEETEAIEAGRFMEPGNRNWYCHRTKQSLLDPNPMMYRHPDYPFIFATPDGIVTERLLLECKNAGEFMKKEWGDTETDNVPTDYLIQCQTQMAVMAADECDLSVVIGGNKLRIYRIPRNDDLISLIYSAAEELWDRIQRRDPPEPDFRHPSTPKLVKELYKTSNDVRILLSPDANAAWEAYEKLGQIASEAEKKQKQLKAFVLWEIGENYAGVLQDGRMIRRKRITKKPSTPEPYWEARAVKFDGGEITELVGIEQSRPIEHKQTLLLLTEGASA